MGSGAGGVTVKASEAETGGLCTVWEGRVEPGTVGVSPHYHHGRDEFFYVLEGELVLRIGEVNHTAPAGFERFLVEMGQLASLNAGKEERAALAARYDMIPAPKPTDA